MALSAVPEYKENNYNRIVRIMNRFISMAVALLLAAGMWAQGLPEPKREFRGAWIQCINGQFQGLGRDVMQANLTRQLDAMQACRVNCIIFQVRGEADALYASQLEPWSRFLTGQQGLAPDPYWDPLAWMVDECHKRGMEIHAWINPYRAKTPSTKSLASNHPYLAHPERFFNYGDLILFNPGLEENRKYICRVVEDIVSRYDVDGLHIDDYFYPYPQAGVPIPDEETFRQYGGGFSNIADWRRDNVNRLVQMMYETVHRVKPWVKFGVAPFGIYHNQRSGGVIPGSATGGLQNYDDLYADVLFWISKGWVDYCIPQLYWEIGHKTADYATLARWWSRYAGGRPLAFGQDVTRTVKALDLDNPTINQLPAKMRLQRTLPNVQGSCLWYSAAVAANEGNVLTALQQMYHTHPALMPRMPFIDNKAPKKVRGLKALWTPDGLVLVWLEPKAKDEMDRANMYVVYRFAKGEKKNLDDASKIVAVTNQTFLRLPYVEGKDKYTYAVTVLDRVQNESKARTTKVKL